MNLWNKEEILAKRTAIDAYVKLIPSDRICFLDELKKTDPKLAVAIIDDPSSNIRFDQVVSGYDVENIYFQCGRGYGKSHACAYRFRCLVDLDYQSIAMVGATHQDLIHVMIPAFLSMFPDNYQPIYNSSQKIIYLPNGGRCYLYTTEKTMRGPNVNAIWWDEVVASNGGTQPNKVLDWYHKSMMSFRGKGKSKVQQKKQMIISSTPAPWQIFRDFNKYCDDPTNKDWLMKQGSAYDNPEMSEDIKKWIELYKGTPLEQQEIYGKLTSKMAGALWDDGLIENAFTDVKPIPTRILIALDPATTNKKNSDEFGICVLGLEEKSDGLGNVTKIGYVLEERTGKYDPQEWIDLTKHLCQKYDTIEIVAESNQGGDMIKQCINADGGSYNIKLIHAKADKKTRAEPISFLYHQGKIRHYHNKADNQQRMGICMLEKELLQWDGKGDSPNRMDAMVHGFTELFYNSNMIYRQPYRNVSKFRA